MCRSSYGTSSANVSAIRSMSASGLCSERTSWNTAASRRYDSMSASARAAACLGSGSGRFETRAALVATVVPDIGTTPRMDKPYGGRARPSSEGYAVKVFALAALPAEEVQLRRHDEIAPRAVTGDVQAADDRGRDPLSLPHHQLGGCSDLVRERDHGGVQLVAGGIADAAKVAQHLDARRADRDVRDPEPPGAAEGVGDDDAEPPAGALLEGSAQPRGR